MADLAYNGQRYPYQPGCQSSNGMETTFPTDPVEVFRKIANGEKIKMIHRLHKAIEELNHGSEEHYMLVVASENIENHCSYYGSRRLVQAAVDSDLQVTITKQNGLDRHTVYVPITSVRAEEDEDKKGEVQLWAKVTHLLDLYNYPSKEHFSYKCKGQLPQIKPKPAFWPREIRYASMMNMTVNNVMENNAAFSYGTKRDAIRRILAAARAHYSSFLRQLKGEDIFLRVNSSSSGQAEPRKRKHSEPSISCQRTANESQAAVSSGRRVWYERPSTAHSGDACLKKWTTPNLQHYNNGYLNDQEPSAIYEPEELFYEHEEIVGPDDPLDNSAETARWDCFERSPNKNGKLREDVDNRRNVNYSEGNTTAQQDTNQPQIVKTVLVNGESGPILRKYIFKLRKK